MLSISRPRTLDLEVHKEKMQQRRQELARSAEANFLIDTLLRNPKRDRRKLKELFYSQASLLEAALEQLSEQEIETLLESGKRLEDALCDLLAELEKVPELGEDKSLALDVVHEMLCGAQQYSGTAASNDVELNPDKFETGALIVDDCVQNSELATQRKVILAEKAERVLEEVVTQRIINSPNVVDDASSKNKRRLAPKNIIFHLK